LVCLLVLLIPNSYTILFLGIIFSSILLLHYIFFSVLTPSEWSTILCDRLPLFSWILWYVNCKMCCMLVVRKVGTAVTLLNIMFSSKLACIFWNYL
jgi:uncharacterized membrane protein (DUF106 family)